MMDLEGLEPRALFAVAPSFSLTPETLGQQFDTDERMQLLGRMTNMSDRFRRQLGGYLRRDDVAAFDDALLMYMRQRRNARFFFDDSDAAALGPAIRRRADVGDEIQPIDQLLSTRKSTIGGVKLVDGFEWDGIKAGVTREQRHALERHSWWGGLALTARYANAEAPILELQRELASWASQNPTAEPPKTWAANDRRAWWFDTAIRVGHWVWAQQASLASDAWTGAANSLMLFKLGQQADYLYAYARQLGIGAVINNQQLQLGSALLTLGQYLPEMRFADRWESQGRGTLLTALDQQFYDDGLHTEASPGYAIPVVNALLETHRLDELNGDHWSKRYLNKLRKATYAVFQFIEPMRTISALSDTDPHGAYFSAFRARVILSNDGYDTPAPNGRDLWVTGRQGVKLSSTQTGLSVDHHTAAAAFPQGGYYVLRNTSGKEDTQLIFDAGPTGGTHGHRDLLSVYLWHDRPILADPGPGDYDDAADRAAHVATAAHNTIQITGQNHAAIEGLNHPDLIATGITRVAGGGFMMGGAHRAYKALAGAPVVARQVYFDGEGTLVIVDRGWSDVAQPFETGFSVPASMGGVFDADTGVYSNPDGMYQYLRVQTLLAAGQSFSQSDTRNAQNQRANRLTLKQTTTSAVFVTVIHIKDPDTQTAIPIEWESKPQAPSDDAVLKVEGRSIRFPAITFGD